MAHTGAQKTQETVAPETVAPQIIVVVLLPFSIDFKKKIKNLLNKKYLQTEAA